MDRGKRAQAQEAEGRRRAKNPKSDERSEVAIRVSGGGRGRARQRGADRRARRAGGRKRTCCTLTTEGPSTRRDAPRSRARARGGALVVDWFSDSRYTIDTQMTLVKTIDSTAWSWWRGTGPPGGR